MIILFLVGVIDMIIIAAWTKLVSDNKIIASGLVTVVNVLTWYYVLQTILEDMGNLQLIVIYALGCALGTMLTTWYFQVKERKEETILQATPASLEA